MHCGHPFPQTNEWINKSFFKKKKIKEKGTQGKWGSTSVGAIHKLTPMSKLRTLQAKAGWASRGATQGQSLIIYSGGTANRN